VKGSALCADLLREDNMRLLIVGGMLALAVSASLTPANAGGGRCPPYRFDHGPPGNKQCDLDAIRRGAPLMRLFDDKKHQECESKWGELV
jgi:hypothetical protein